MTGIVFFFLYKKIRLVKLKPLKLKNFTSLPHLSFTTRLGGSRNKFIGHKYSTKTLGIKNDHPHPWSLRIKILMPFLVRKNKFRTMRVLKNTNRDRTRCCFRKSIDLKYYSIHNRW